MRNVGEMWIFWMNIAAWNFIGLSVLGFLSIIGACFPPARKFAACCGCFGTVFHLFTIIALTILSFSNDGQFCSTPLLNGLIKENDTYAQKHNTEIETGIDILNKVNPVETQTNIMDKFSEINYHQDPFNIIDAFNKINEHEKGTNIHNVFDKVNFGDAVTNNAVEVFNKLNYHNTDRDVKEIFENINSVSETWPHDAATIFSSVNTRNDVRDSAGIFE